MDVSVVIPVYRDRQALERMLTALAALDPQPSEVVVVDGGSEPDIEALCAGSGCRYLASRACRGDQMDRGARAASNELLWFLHADNTPRPDSIAVIRAHMGTGTVGGWFRFVFERERCWQARLLAFLINLRARIGTPYGDQGLFMRRDAYRQAGGFPPRALFEEPPLVKRLRKSGRFAPVTAALGVSARRWKRDGWFRRSVRNRALALAYILRRSPDDLARRYFRPG
ncbi:MAG: TIGR04283 family arsenosugar biosynthesis glycosyltransferase [Gammaproteobacteria bacterium]|nr:TIGR04283 family arsenosugar biosynthesis glycosyltransferase [Gammaproteobacteria bacterium]MXW46527.1 glycosyltransferase [Gammaproteobacteria bacterium]MYD01557.1 glycosyltransferase [Gammaproteobacteria bacterium]MYI26304.1 glycosyltransferase [Gammaproteobacteria bacterium]